MLFTDVDFAGALIKLQVAFDKFGDARLLGNIAACEKNLRHYSKARRLLTRYTKGGGALLTSDDLRDGRELVSTLEPLTTQVTFAVNKPGAELFIDDEKVGTTPTGEPIMVDVGMRRFRVVKQGYRPHEVSVPIGGAKTATVDVALPTPPPPSGSLMAPLASCSRPPRSTSTLSPPPRS